MRVTECLLRRKSCLDKVQPEDDLTQLDVGRVSEADDDNVNTAGVSNEQVVCHVVRLVTRKLPNAYLTHTWTALDSLRKT